MKNVDEDSTKVSNTQRRKLKSHWTYLPHFQTVCRIPICTNTFKIRNQFEQVLIPNNVSYFPRIFLRKKIQNEECGTLIKSPYTKTLRKLSSRTIGSESLSVKFCRFSVYRVPKVYKIHAKCKIRVPRGFVGQSQSVL